MNHCLCALLLLVSAQRMQTMHLIRLKWTDFHNRGFHLLEKAKHTRPSHIQSALKLTNFQEEEKLCTEQCLIDCIKRTAPFTSGGEKLLLCCVRPYGPASRDTVACNKKAGIQGFAPYSIRGASLLLSQSLFLLTHIIFYMWTDEYMRKKFMCIVK